MKPPPRSSKGGTFGVFLKEVKRRKEEGAAPSPSSPAGLLGLLDRDPKSVTEVMKQSGMSLQEFAALLHNMSEEGFVRMEGEAGNETIRLSKAGEQLRKLTLPAER